LGLFEQLAKDEEYPQFWKAFGGVLKEGIIEDASNRERIAKLLRFASTHDDSDDENVTLEAYLERMPEDQKAIYYLIADTLSTAKNSPHLEVFRAQGIEVLLLCDPVDEWLVGHLGEFGGKPLKSVLHGELDLPDKECEPEKEAKEPEDEAVSKLVDGIKKVLDDKVRDVRATKRLVSSPACLVSDEQQISANLERILKASGQDVPATKRILEVNPGHPIIARLAEEQSEDGLQDWALILYEQALLAEGGRLDDPAGFVGRINKMLLERSGS